MCSRLPCRQNELVKIVNINIYSKCTLQEHVVGEHLLELLLVIVCLGGHIYCLVVWN